MQNKILKAKSNTGMSVLEGLKKENIERMWEWRAETAQLLLCYNSFLTWTKA